MKFLPKIKKNYDCCQTYNDTKFFSEIAMSYSEEIDSNDLSAGEDHIKKNIAVKPKKTKKEKHRKNKSKEGGLSSFRFLFLLHPSF